MALAYFENQMCLTQYPAEGKHSINTSQFEVIITFAAPSFQTVDYQLETFWTKAFKQWPTCRSNWAQPQCFQKGGVPALVVNLTLTFAQRWPLPSSLLLCPFVSPVQPAQTFELLWSKCLLLHPQKSRERERKKAIKKDWETFRDSDAEDNQEREVKIYCTDLCPGLHISLSLWLIIYPWIVWDYRVSLDYRVCLLDLSRKPTIFLSTEITLRNFFRKRFHRTPGSLPFHSNISAMTQDKCWGGLTSSNRGTALIGARCGGGSCLTL